MSPKIIYTDLSTYTTISGSDGYSGSNAWSNLQSYENTDVWTSNTTGSQRVYIDFGTATTFNSMVIDNNNFADLASDSIRLLAADDAAFSTGSVVVLSGLQSSGSLFVGTFSSTTKRYWGIDFYSFTGEFTDYPEIGNLFLSNCLTFDTPYNFGYKKENREFITSEKITLSGKLVTVQSYAGRILYELNFNLQGDTLKTNFQTFQSTVRGKLRPFYFVDTDGTTIRYMHCTDDYVPVEVQRYGYNNIAMNLRTHTSDY